jgi:hypothetical protein
MVRHSQFLQKILGTDVFDSSRDATQKEIIPVRARIALSAGYGKRNMTGTSAIQAAKKSRCEQHGAVDPRPKSLKEEGAEDFLLLNNFPLRPLR